jgi:RsmE family RNA methyltransferase
MNCLLLEPEEWDVATGRARVAGRRRRHAEEILKLAAGDVLRVGVVGGRLGRGRIERLDAESLELEVELDEDPPAKRPLELVLALPRMPVFRRLVSTAASLGVERLLVVGTARTEKSYWQSGEVSEAAIRERLLLGLEQARDSVVPKVELHRRFDALVEDVLRSGLAGRRGLVAHPSAPDPCPHRVAGPVTLFVGPEGGLLDGEVERLVSIGFEPVHLGPRILRVEPVIPLLVGRLFD